LGRKLSRKRSSIQTGDGWEGLKICLGGGQKIATPKSRRGHAPATRERDKTKDVGKGSPQKRGRRTLWGLVRSTPGGSRRATKIR